jgi:hypothetical protein
MTFEIQVLVWDRQKSESANGRGLLLTKKLLNQGFLLVRLKSSLRKFDGRHHDFVNRYRTSVSQMIMDMFPLSALSGPFLIHDLSSSF